MNIYLRFVGVQMNGNYFVLSTVVEYFIYKVHIPTQSIPVLTTCTLYCISRNLEM